MKKPRKPGVRGFSGLGGVDVRIGVDPLAHGVTQLRTQAGTLHAAQTLAIVLADFLAPPRPARPRQFAVADRRMTPTVMSMVVLEIDHVVTRIKITVGPDPLPALAVKEVVVMPDLTMNLHRHVRHLDIPGPILVGARHGLLLFCSPLGELRQDAYDHLLSIVDTL